jgi:hypothetical protein
MRTFLAATLLCLACATTNPRFITSPDDAASLGLQYEAVVQAMKDKQLTLEQTEAFQKFQAKFEKVYVLSAKTYSVCAETNDDAICEVALDLVSTLTAELHIHAKVAGVVLPGSNE